MTHAETRFRVGGTGVKAIRRVLAVALAALAIAQWAVVLERTLAALWQFFKFASYGGGGHIDVGRTTQIVFLIGSVLVGSVAGVLWRGMGDEDSKPWKRLALLSCLSVAGCTVLWAILLASPLVTWVSR